MLRFGRMLAPLEYKSELIARVCGAEASTYADRKHRGGVSSQQGASFEVVYAAYRIALAGQQACQDASSYEDVWFQSQTGGFVDDLATVTARKMALAQAKSGAATWTGGDHSIADDFRMQRLLDRDAGYEADHELVVSSDGHADAMRQTRPEDLNEVAVTAFRYSGNDWLGLFTAHPELASALDAISIRPPAGIVREQTF